MTTLNPFFNQIMNPTPSQNKWSGIHIFFLLILLFSKSHLLFGNKTNLRDSFRVPIKHNFLNKGRLQISSLQGIAYYNLPDSSGKRRWLAYDIGTSIFVDYFVIKRLSIGTGISFYFSKYHYTFDRANLNFQGYLKYYPKFGNTNAKLKFLTNNFFLILGYGQGNEYITPQYKSIFARNKSIFTGFGFSVVPLKLFKKTNFHWGFDFMWYTPNIILFKDHLTANPGGIGIKYFW